MIRTPAENSLMQTELIAISKDWTDQLHYEIIVSGKCFPMGSQVPIALKLTPLAKVQFHCIKVLLTESIEYFANHRKAHRLKSHRGIQLVEKIADGPLSSAFPGSSARVFAGAAVDFDPRDRAVSGDENIERNKSDDRLGHLEAERYVGPTEMEFMVQLPSCNTMKEEERIHVDTTYKQIQIHHWIKVMFCTSRTHCQLLMTCILQITIVLSQPDPNDSCKRKRHEISINSPFYILSCHATRANVDLPAYNKPEAPGIIYECGCPGARRRNPRSYPISSVGTSSRSASEGIENIVPGRPSQAHVTSSNSAIQRLMRLLRNPSYNPPAFEEDITPPQLVTPPPQYDSIMSDDGLADYFLRLADEMGNQDNDEDDSRAGARLLGLPLTPGGRVNRSLSERRTWTPIGHPT